MEPLDTKPKFFRHWLRVFWAVIKKRKWGAAWELTKTLIEEIFE